jgi:hypothetical protein
LQLIGYGRPPGRWEGKGSQGVGLACFATRSPLGGDDHRLTGQPYKQPGVLGSYIARIVLRRAEPVQWRLANRPSRRDFTTGSYDCPPRQGTRRLDRLRHIFRPSHSAGRFSYDGNFSAGYHDIILPFGCLIHPVSDAARQPGGSGSYILPTALHPTEPARLQTDLPVITP